MAYFVSDAHFGAEFTGAYPHRQKHFCDFLESIRSSASHLFILGDLFEFWMEYRYYVPKGPFPVLAKLLDLTRDGIPVHYLSGNHDFNLGLFLRDSVGVQTHHGPQVVELQGKRLLLLHGDGIVEKDWKYRQLKKVLIHPLANWAFKCLHPDWGMALARFVGGASRLTHKPTSKEAYRKAALNLLREHGAEIVMHGHTHLHFVREEPGGVYANSGEWLRRLQYIDMKDGVLSPREFTPSPRR